VINTNKTIKDKLVEYFENMLKGGVEYRETMLKQIEAGLNEINSAKKAVEEFDKKLEDIKEYLEFIKKVKE
jgi:uncharacterized protein Yka (UPF0111/DUF47 family)